MFSIKFHSILFCFLYSSLFPSSSFILFYSIWIFSVIVSSVLFLSNLYSAFYIQSRSSIFYFCSFHHIIIFSVPLLSFFLFCFFGIILFHSILIFYILVFTVILCSAIFFSNFCSIQFYSLNKKWVPDFILIALDWCTISSSACGISEFILTMVCSALCKVRFREQGFKSEMKLSLRPSSGWLQYTQTSYNSTFNMLRCL